MVTVSYNLNKSVVRHSRLTHNKHYNLLYILSKEKRKILQSHAGTILFMSYLIFDIITVWIWVTNFFIIRDKIYDVYKVAYPIKEKARL